MKTRVISTIALVFVLGFLSGCRSKQCNNCALKGTPAPRVSYERIQFTDNQTQEQSDCPDGLCPIK